MIRRNRKARRGAAAVETALAYSILIPILLGTLVVGLGVFRYHQLNAIACESARWASVRGPTYQGETGGSAPTTSDMLKYARSKAEGMDQAKLNGSLVMSSDTATVTLQYQWVPETSVLQPMTFTATAAAPITY